MGERRTEGKEEEIVFNVTRIRALAVLLGMVLAVQVALILVAAPAQAAASTTSINLAPAAFSFDATAGAGSIPTSAVVSGGGFGSGATIQFVVSASKQFTKSSPVIGSLTLPAGQTTIPNTKIDLFKAGAGSGVIRSPASYFISATDDGGLTFAGPMSVTVTLQRISLDVSPASLTPFPTNQVSLSGDGYTAGKEVDFFLDAPGLALGTPEGNATAGSDGTITATFSFPARPKNSYSIYAVDKDSGLTNGVGSALSIVPGIRVELPSGIIGATAGQSFTVDGAGYSAGAKIASNSITVAGVPTQHSQVNVDNTGSWSQSIKTTGTLATGFQSVVEPSTGSTARNLLVSLPGFTNSVVALEPGKSSSVSVGDSKQIFVFNYLANTNLNLVMGNLVLGTVTTESHGAAIQSFAIPSLPGTALGQPYSVDGVNSAQGLSALTKLSLSVQSEVLVKDLLGKEMPLVEPEKVIQVIGTGLAARDSLTITAGAAQIAQASSDGVGSFSVSIPVQAPQPFVTGALISVSVGGPRTGLVTVASAFIQHAQPTVLALDKRVGGGGDNVTVTGHDFAPATTYEILFNGASFSPAKKFTATASGAIPAPITFAVPALTQRIYRVAAAQAAAAPAAWEFFGLSQPSTIAAVFARVGSQEPVQSLNAQAGAAMDLYLLGWAKGESISVKLVGQGAALATASAASSGAALLQGVRVPLLAGGSYLLFAQGANSGLADQNVLLALQVKFALASQSGNIGDTVSFSASGLAANTAYDILFDQGTRFTGVSGSDGTLSGSFTVPSAIAAGAHPVKLVSSADQTAVAGSASFKLAETFLLDPAREALVGQLVHFTFNTAFTAAQITPPVHVTVLIDGAPYATLTANNDSFPLLSGAFAMPNGDPNTQVSVSVSFFDSDTGPASQHSGSSSAAGVMRMSGAGALISGIDLAQQFAIVKGSLGNISIDLGQLKPLVTRIDGNVATIQTNLGLMQADVTAINAKVTSIQGTVATISTDVGSLKVDVTAIHAQITSIQGNMATLTTDVGQATTAVQNLQPVVTSIQGDVAQVKTSVGDLSGKVTDVQNGVATIKTDVGTLQASVSGLPGTTAVNNILYVAIAAAVLALIGAVGAITAAAVIMRRLAK